MKPRSSLDPDLRITGVNVCGDEDHFVSEIGRICKGFIKDSSVDININSTGVVNQRYLQFISAIDDQLPGQKVDTA